MCFDLPGEYMQQARYFRRLPPLDSATSELKQYDLDRKKIHRVLILSTLCHLPTICLLIIEIVI